MDFGILYMPNKAASQAAMGLGCFVFLFCILIPYIVCWEFIPLYLFFLIVGAFRIFNVENPAFTFLFPLAPFAAACALCLPFWWAIPTIVIFSNDLLDMINPFYDGSILFRDSIPDDKCFLYFIGVVGGSVGSFFSIISIGSLWSVSENAKQHIEHKRKNEPNHIRDIKNIKSKFDAHAISVKEANSQIAHNVEKWGKGLGLSQSTIQRYYDAHSIKETDSPKNPIVSPETSKREKMKSLCIRASIDFTPQIKKLRKQFIDGKMSKDEAMKSIYADFEKWKAEFDLSDNESKAVWKSICKKANFN